MWRGSVHTLPPFNCLTFCEHNSREHVEHLRTEWTTTSQGLLLLMWQACAKHVNTVHEHMQQSYGKGPCHDMLIFLSYYVHSLYTCRATSLCACRATSLCACRATSLRRIFLCQFTIYVVSLAHEFQLVRYSLHVALPLTKLTNNIRLMDWIQQHFTVRVLKIKYYGQIFVLCASFEHVSLPKGWQKNSRNLVNPRMFGYFQV